jgi:IS5 family transposase
LDNGSRMTRECHVRFCERLRGQVPWPTHHFGMKAHIGVDAESGLVHSLTTTAANIADIVETAALLHGDEDTVFADAGYTGVAKREEMNTVAVDSQIAAKRSTVKKVNEKRPLRGILDELEHAKASIRAKVEHPFHVVKNLFRHRKTRYKGLPKIRHTCSCCLAWAISSLQKTGWWPGRLKLRQLCEKRCKRRCVDSFFESYLRLFI